MGKKNPTSAVGTNVPRAEGIEKITGQARYIDDYHFPDLIYGATVRSTVPHAQIRKVELDKGFDWSGFTVVDHRDIVAPGKNIVAMIVEDQPFLAVSEVQHQAEPILLVAHADRARLADALDHIDIEYAGLPTTLDFEHAEKVLKEINIRKGDVQAGFAEADLIVESTYRTGAQEQLYIENHGAIAIPDYQGPDGITVMGSMQCPYYVSRALQVLFGLPVEKVRVVQTTTGGGFGGKEDYPSLICGHAALLARKARRPVKMMYERHEDMVATTKRHPSIVRHRTGVKKDGTLIATEIDFRVDGGAYVTLSPVVLSRGSIHSTGPYRYPHVHVRGRIMHTHTPPNGAFRGFGAPQSQFAAEVHMDEIAARLGMDPIALRRKNLLRLGDTTATGQLLKESVSAELVLDRALKKHGKPAKPAKGKLGGTGVALFFHGSGFTGGGEVRLASKAGVELKKDGVKILVASTEIGQGTRTMHAQIVADALGIPYDMVETADPDTAHVPDSGPTVASRTCMVVGGILARAAGKIRAELGDYTDGDGFRKLARVRLKQGPLVVVEKYEKPGDIVWSDETYLGDAYGAYGWGCNIADVEIDPLTYEARCTRITAAIDIGKAIHPILAEGQIEGGTLQSVGWALYEDVVMQKGKMQNAQLTNYIIPTTLDAPEIRVDIVENPYSGGPFGAKGVGECPTDGPAAAIANAVRKASGQVVNQIPILPERLMPILNGSRS